ncbi:DUF4124 domain-containing protein [Shewanella sp. YIC-542]|uniref:DUF4124 domain-containing protein n=1 Tax=Shewanella mytili TaxID=3377111 RepID=UPI00398E54FB
MLLSSASGIATAGDSKLIYKCIANDEVIFSQLPCPANYTQHQIEYHYGLATETPPPTKYDDPLLAMLAQKDLTEAQLQRWLKSEIERLQQEQQYLEIRRTSDLEQLERQRYWEDTPQQAPEFIEKLHKINLRYDALKQHNHDALVRLQQYRQQLAE